MSGEEVLQALRRCLADNYDVCKEDCPMFHETDCMLKTMREAASLIEGLQKDGNKLTSWIDEIVIDDREEISFGENDYGYDELYASISIPIRPTETLTRKAYETYKNGDSGDPWNYWYDEFFVVIDDDYWLGNNIGILCTVKEIDPDSDDPDHGVHDYCRLDLTDEECADLYKKIDSILAGLGEMPIVGWLNGSWNALRTTHGWLKTYRQLAWPVEDAGNVLTENK